MTHKRARWPHNNMEQPKETVEIIAEISFDGKAHKVGDKPAVTALTALHLKKRGFARIPLVKPQPEPKSKPAKKKKA